MGPLPSGLSAWRQGHQVTNVIPNPMLWPSRAGTYLCVHLSVLLDLLGLVWFPGEKGTIHGFPLVCKAYLYRSRSIVAYCSCGSLSSTIATCGGLIPPFAVAAG